MYSRSLPYLCMVLITFSIDKAILLASGHKTMTSAALVNYIHHKIPREKALVVPGQTVTPLLQKAPTYASHACVLPQSNGITDVQEIIRILSDPDRRIFSRTNHILIPANIPG